MKTIVFSVALLALGLASTSVRADVIFIRGGTTPAEENVIFNLPGLIHTGNPVQGRTESTNNVLNFTFPFMTTFPLTTTSPGEPRITMPGRVFNSLRFQFDDPLVSFTQLDFAVNADQVGSITFTAVTTDGQVFTGQSTLSAPFINPFSVIATDGQRLREVSYASPAPFTVDVRRIRVGGVASEPTPVPEPGACVLLASGLLSAAGVVLRRK